MSEENKRRLKEYEKNYREIKKKLFLLHIIKMEQKALIFAGDCFNQNAFHKNGKPASIDKVDILISTSNRSVLSNKDSYVN